MSILSYKKKINTYLLLYIFFLYIFDLRLSHVKIANYFHMYYLNKSHDSLNKSCDKVTVDDLINCHIVGL